MTEILFDVPPNVNGIAIAADLAAAGHDVANVYITYPEGEPQLAVIGDNLDRGAVGAVIAAFVPPAPVVDVPPLSDAEVVRLRGLLG